MSNITQTLQEELEKLQLKDKDKETAKKMYEAVIKIKGGLKQ